MWNQWILQNQWPWLLLCVGFSTKPQGGGSVEAVPRYPTPLPLEMLLTLASGEQALLGHPSPCCWHWGHTVFQLGEWWQPPAAFWRIFASLEQLEGVS